MKEDFNFDGMIEVAATGYSGGISILWLSSVLVVEPVATTAQEIHCHVQVKPLPFKFLFTAIYASNELVNRKSLWETLIYVYDSYKGPWIIKGDFNEITHATDKFGGLPINNSRSHKFLDCLNYCQMTDLGYKGSRYTWTNGRHKKYTILERIDRIVAKYDWINQYPDALVTHLPVHTQIIVAFDYSFNTVLYLGKNI
ncbi:uncharacterized protein LOC142174494 [Nicotiana tabacum]|uniref:Uncharacterized protein LOC142174494 n=1 Tax=Nicotiana tabacum TaxID=4097 RepID=A0AC58TGQ9_TOBAC